VFFGPVHASPDEAVQIHIDVAALKSIAMHWGTFNLADEPLSEPPVYLRQASKAAGLQRDEFVVLRFWESLNIDSKNP
jgi:L-ascorbate metabolism protein UlaG (beta-lactamase superfamily)